MNIVICDDEKYYQDAVINAIDNWTRIANYNNIRYQCFSSTEDLLEKWENGLHIDLIFLDIQIPGELSGMALAQKIRVSDQNITIVFITNYSNYVYEGYTVNALRYLRKPIQEQEVYSCLELAHRQFSLLQNSSILIETRDQSLVLRHADIIYIESQSHYLTFCLTYNMRPVIRKKLSQLLLHLPSELFVQCHRSYLVNLAHIRRFTSNIITMSNNQTLPVSSTFSSALHIAFVHYYREERIP